MAAKVEAKPRKGRLKVFRTAVGFHDAYIAAPSRKAALEAWGTDKDLFARGLAEEVTDPELMTEPLSAPGTVFRRLRSAPADLAAKPRAPRKKKSRTEPARQASMQPIPTAPPPPPPSKDEVDEAQRTLDTARKQHEAEQRELAVRERELAAERRAMESRQTRDLRRLTDRLEAAQQDYAARLDAWHKETGRRRKT